MSDKLNDTLKEMEELAETHKVVAVGFSGGKDSLVTLDLALKVFDRVHAYFMYFVPGLEMDIRRMQYCIDHFGIKPLMYPSPFAIKAFRTFTDVDPMPEFELMPELDVRDVEVAVRNDTGATLMMTGMKKADGMFRRRNIANSKKYTDRYLPLKHWVRWEVLSYLKLRGIPLPDDQVQQDNAGMGLTVPIILFLYDHHRADYETVKTYFPYIEAIVWRREWFGLSRD